MGASGVGIGGSFYRYSYVVAQGQIVTGPDIYVIVFNQGEEPLNISMNYEVRPGIPFVRIRFSNESFVLEPGEAVKVYISIEVGDRAPPGNYTVGVIANVIVTPPEQGSIAVPAAAQYTNLTVTGASASLRVLTVDITGRPVPAYIRLYAVSPAGNYTVAESRTGELNITLAPGSYVASAYVAGVLLNSTVVTLAPGEYKEVRLVVSTVYFEYFYVMPALDREGRIGYAQAIGVVQNLLKPIPNAAIILLVDYNGSPYEEITVTSLSELPKGRSEYRHSYVPKDGWRAGVYGFRMRLVSGGVIYAETPERYLTVNKSMLLMPAGPQPTPSWLVPTALGAGAAGVLALVFAARRRKRLVLRSWDYRDGRLRLEFINRSNEEVRFYEIVIKSRRETVSTAQSPRLRPTNSPTLPPGSSGIALIRDKDGSIEKHLLKGGLTVIVNTSIGRRKFRIRGGKTRK